MGEGMKERLTIRATKEVEAIIKLMLEKYPEDYKTHSDVLRAAVFTLERWKEQKERDSKIQIIYNKAMKLKRR